MKILTFPDHKSVVAYFEQNTSPEPVLARAPRMTYLYAHGRLISKRTALNHKRQYGTWPYYPKINFTFDFTNL